MLTDEMTPASEDVLDLASPDEWVDAPAPAPLPAGKYRLRLMKIERDADRATGVPRKSFTASFVVAEGPSEGRPVNFISVSTNVYPRTAGGRTANVCELGDFIRAFDKTYHLNSIEGGKRFLDEKVADGAVCTLYLDWKAWDTKHWQDRNGGSLSRDEQKALRKECDIKGMRKFNADGTVTNPISGNVLKARLFMREAIASDKE
jgi:hypothetical protein